MIDNTDIEKMTYKLILILFLDPFLYLDQSNYEQDSD